MKLPQLRALWLVWLGLFFASGTLTPQAFAQTSITTTSSATSGCATFATDTNTSTVGIQVTGTWTGTLQPEVAIQGQAAANSQVTPSTSSTAQSTITANGVYTASVAGSSVFLLCGPTSTGTAVVYLNGSKAAVKVQGGAGGGVTSFTGDGTIITNSASTGAVTATIAGTSGGIPYFSSSSGWASSGALTANVLMKGGGAGAAPAPSSITDNGTTVTTTDNNFVVPNGGSANKGLQTLDTNTAIRLDNSPARVLFQTGAGVFPFFCVATGCTVQTGVTLTSPNYLTATNCEASGTAANPSVVSCSSAAAGIVYCDVAASAGTCQINTTALGTNSEVQLTISAAAADGTLLSKTCNTSPSTVPSILLNAKSNGASFTINMPTVTTNGVCFHYTITNK